MAILRLSGFVVFSSNDRAGTKYLDVVVLPNSVLPLGVVQYTFSIGLLYNTEA
jgi:hypothetical protein